MLEIRILISMFIRRLHRCRLSEAVQQLVDKVEYYLRSCSAEEWALVFPGRADDRDTFIYNSERNKISLNTPASHWGAHGISPIAPRQEAYGTTQFGNDETLLISGYSPCPCLEIARTKQPADLGTSIPYAFEAKQLAPALGIGGTWDEPALRKKDLRWKPSKIEYCMADMTPGRILLPVKDCDGCIRGLIEIRTAPDMVLPLSYAQDAKDYCFPMACNFTFETSWNLLNVEYLPIFPQAEIVLTNELGVVLGNKPDAQTLILGYAFGFEMIAHLKLEGLRGRRTILLVIHPPNPAEFRENLREAVALLDRFSDLDIPVSIAYTECKYAGGGISRGKFLISEREIELNYLDERYSAPLVMSRDALVKMAMARQILIPDNLRLDRLGRIPERKQTPIIADLLDSGSTTAILAHDGVDISLVCGSLVAGMLGDARYVFPERWKIMPGCTPVVLTASRARTGIERTIAGLHARTCPLYTLPSGTKAEIEQRLAAIRHETGANTFIFTGSQILAEQKKLLEVASVWVQKADVGMVICGNERSCSGALDFLDETCWRRFLVLPLCSNDPAYLVKEYDPFSENPQMFKLVLKQGAWATEEPTAGDKREAMKMLPARQDFGERENYQEDTTQKELKNLV